MNGSEQMIRVPRDLLNTAVNGHRSEHGVAMRDLRELLHQAAEQCQVEPVAWVRVIEDEPMKYSWFGSKRLPVGKHHLYTHVDPAEVEGLREQLAEANGRIRTLEAVNEAGTWADTATDKENDALRAQLAERDALLRDWLQGNGSVISLDMRTTDLLAEATSASADHSVETGKKV